MHSRVVGSTGLGIWVSSTSFQIIAIWKTLYLSEAATSVNADVGIATNSLKDKLTVSTIVAWKISRGSERNLQENKENQGIRDQVIQSPFW